MKFSPEILDELRNISPLLAGIEKKNMLSVPEGYFDSLTIDVLKKVSTGFDADKLSVPEGYFANLSDQILNKIKFSEQSASQELRTLSPMLYAIQSEKVFNVPSGYFNNLSDNTLEKVVPQQAKVVEFSKRRSIWQYAVAAVATGIIAVSSLFIFNRSQTTDNNPSVSAFIQQASQFKNQQQISAGIASLSDDEIIKYLEKTGTDVDNEVLIKNIDEKALPDQTDYLLNDQLLDKYLSDINKKNSND